MHASMVHASRDSHTQGASALPTTNSSHQGKGAPVGAHKCLGWQVNLNCIPVTPDLRHLHKDHVPAVPGLLHRFPHPVPQLPPPLLGSAISRPTSNCLPTHPPLLDAPLPPPQPTDTYMRITSPQSRVSCISLVTLFSSSPLSLAPAINSPTSNCSTRLLRRKEGSGWPSRDRSCTIA